MKLFGSFLQILGLSKTMHEQSLIHYLGRIMLFCNIMINASITLIALYSGTVNIWLFMLNSRVLQCSAINATFYATVPEEGLSPHMLTKCVMPAGGFFSDQTGIKLQIPL